MDRRQFLVGATARHVGTSAHHARGATGSDVGYFPTTAQPDAGLEPDVQVALTAADIANGRDPVLDRAAAWVARGQ